MRVIRQATTPREQEVLAKLAKGFFVQRNIAHSFIHIHRYGETHAVVWQTGVANTRAWNFTHRLTANQGEPESLPIVMDYEKPLTALLVADRGAAWPATNGLRSGGQAGHQFSSCLATSGVNTILWATAMHAQYGRSVPEA